MGLSNYLPSSRISQSGVCTSTTRPASPYEGQVIYETDTDRVLVWNASAWVAPNSQTANPPGLELVKTQTVGTGVSSVTVTDAFNANYDAYKIIISGGVGSSVALISCQLGVTTTGYYWGHTYRSYAGVSSGANGANVANFARVGLGTTDILTGDFDLVNPFLAKNTVIHYSFVDARTTGEAGAGGGYLANTTSYTDFTIAPSSGTFTGGAIRVYGYRN